MQPNPLSTLQEEPQPESVSPEQQAQSLESPPLMEDAPSEPPPVVAATHPEPNPPAPAKKSPRWSIIAMTLGFLVVILLIGVAGLGLWAYTLNTRLITTQQQLTALQADHDKLQTNHATLVSDHEKQNTELAQIQADLETANKDLTTAQGDLKKTKDQVRTLNAQISKAKNLANILYIWFTSDKKSDVFELVYQIDKTNDKELRTLWTDFVLSGGTEEGFRKLIIHLVTDLRDSLK